jgi:hypothetical protein
MRNGARCIALILLVVVVGAATAVSAHAQAPGHDGMIAYVIRPDVWVMNADGSNKHLLIAKADQPAWSPDGTRIAFVRSADIWVADADGTNQRQVTTAASQEDAPTWSPDGSKILFDSSRSSPGPGLYTIRSTAPYGTATRVVASDQTGGPGAPTWSHTGVIAYPFVPAESDPPDFTDDVRKLANGTTASVTACTFCQGIDWAPGSGRLAFADASLTPDFVVGFITISVIRADGTGRVDLSHSPLLWYQDTHPSWAPAGDWIAFTELFESPTQFQKLGIWKMRPNGTNRVRLARAGIEPAWQPVP